MVNYGIIYQAAAASRTLKIKAACPGAALELRREKWSKETKLPIIGDLTWTNEIKDFKSYCILQ